MVLSKSYICIYLIATLWRLKIYIILGSEAKSYSLRCERNYEFGGQKEFTSEYATKKELAQRLYPKFSRPSDDGFSHHTPQTNSSSS